MNGFSEPPLISESMANEMEDSETKTVEQPVLEKPAVSVEIVRHKGGNCLTKRVRGEGGRFQKQAKTMPKAIDVTRAWRNLMNQPIADENGKMTKGGMTRARLLFDRLFANATMNPEQPVLDKDGKVVMDGRGKPLTYKDAKIMMASAASAKELALRVWGMPSKSDEELEAQKTQAVKVVILQHPDMMDKNIYEEKPRETLKPAFAEVLEITENT